MEQITDAIWVGKRRINNYNWAGAQNAFLYYCANQDPEKPGTKLEVTDFLPYPEVMVDRSKRVLERLSKKTRRELTKAVSDDIFGPAMSLLLYSKLQ